MDYEDYKFGTYRQQMIDDGTYRSNTMEEKKVRTPEEQEAYNAEIKMIWKLMRAVAPVKIHVLAAEALASMVRAVAAGELKPEDIPPTTEEILLVVYKTLGKKVLKPNPMPC